MYRMVTSYKLVVTGNKFRHTETASLQHIDTQYIWCTRACSNFRWRKLQGTWRSPPPRLTCGSIRFEGFNRDKKEVRSDWTWNASLLRQSCELLRITDWRNRIVFIAATHEQTIAFQSHLTCRIRELLNPANLNLMRARINKSTTMTFIPQRYLTSAKA